MEITTKIAVLIIFIPPIFLIKCDGMENNNKKRNESDGPLNEAKMGENRSSSSSSINSNLIDPINSNLSDLSDYDDQPMLIPNEWAINMLMDNSPFVNPSQSLKQNQFSSNNENFPSSSSSLSLPSSSEAPNILYENANENKNELGFLNANWPVVQQKTADKNNDYEIQKEKRQKLEELQMGNGALDEQQIEAQRGLKLLLHNIWYIIMLSFAILQIQLAPIETTMLQVQQGAKFNFYYLNLALEKMNADKILENIGTELVQDKMIQNNKLFMDIIGEINVHAKKVFGQQLYEIKSVQPNNTQVEAETFESKKLKVLYFYMQLFRKLIGQLETPYNKNYIINDKIYQCQTAERRFIVLWIHKALEKICEKFESVAKGPNINDSGEKIFLANALNRLIWTKEIIVLAYFGVRQTLALIYEQRRENVLSMSKQSLADLLNETTKNDLACLLLSHKESLNLEQIVKNISISKNDFGASVFFHNILIHIHQKHINQYKEPIYKIITFAHLYRLIFEYFDGIFNKINGPIIQQYIGLDYKIMKEFFEKSTKQLNGLIARGKSDKPFLFALKESEEAFISDYLLENCTHLIDEQNN